MPKAAKTDIWMPLYVGDLLADTLLLSRADLGSYLLLMCAYWRRHGPLPDDDNALSEAARVALRDWPPVRAVLAPFFQVGDGVWRHKRIDHELAEAENRRQARSRAGRKGAEARWSDGHGPANGKRIANDMAKDVAQNSSSPSPSQDKYIKNDKPAQSLNSDGSRRLHGIPAGVEEVIAYGQSLNPKVSEEQCRAFWAHYEGQARTNTDGDIFWVTSGEAVITNWKAKLPQFRALHETNRRTNKPNPRNAGLSASAVAGQRHAEAFQRRTKQQ
jgi:uncharacterized protein YdaU (DUF1376 family)